MSERSGEVLEIEAVRKGEAGLSGSSVIDNDVTEKDLRWLVHAFL